VSKEKPAEADAITNELIDDICARLKRNSPVRCKMPVWGRLHIDRQLPFVCVYRRPTQRDDPGTEHLLLGEASYILAPGDKDKTPELSRLIEKIAYTQLSTFGAFLILEIWSAEDTCDEEKKAAPHETATFRIVTTRHNAPKAYLEALESALLGISLKNLPLSVALDYQEQVAPFDQDSLFTKKVISDKNIFVVGLEIHPTFRDPETGEILPFRLKALRHTLTHALKQSFFDFAHGYTTHRPAHFHELGRHAMTAAVWETDKQLAEINSQFDILLHVTPVNVPEAWLKFKQQGYQVQPEFNYRPRPVDTDLLKRRLYQIPIERIEDPTLAHIFAAKRDELDRQINMIADRNTSRFLYVSQQVYGPVDDWILSLAHQLADQIPATRIGKAPGLFLDADAFAARANEELEYYRKSMPDLPARVEVRDDVPGILVSRGHLLIGRSVQISADRVNATLSHELGTHIVTYYNGRSQPFRQLYAGLAGYESLQEGLAVLSEYLAGELTRPRLRLLAGRVLAVSCLSRGLSFVDTFNELTKHHDFEEETAFLITMRVYRGGGFTKDAVYLRGLAELLDYLANGGDFDLLLLGKITLEHLHFVEELRWRKVLQTGPLRPRYLESSEATIRLERLKHGMSISQLIEECAP